MQKRPIPDKVADSGHNLTVEEGADTGKDRITKKGGNLHYPLLLFIHSQMRRFIFGDR